MHILSPEDRVQLWHKAITSLPEDRDLLLKLLAREALDAAGQLDLYSGYEDLFLETFHLLHQSGYLGRDEVRHAFEQADESRDDAALLVAVLATQLRESADADHLDAEARVRALDLAHRWRDVLAEHGSGDRTWLSVADVAAHFGVTPQAVYKWIREKKVRFEQRPGGSYRLPADQFESDRERSKRILELRQRLLAKHADDALVDDEQLVAEIRARRRS